MNEYTGGGEKMLLLFTAKCPLIMGTYLLLNIIYSVETWWRLLKQVIKFNIFHDGTGWHQTPPDMIH